MNASPADLTGIEPTPFTSGYGWALIQMVGALVVVCLLAYLILRLVTRVLDRGLGQRYAPARTIKVLERCALAPGKTLWLVEAAGRVFLLGAAEGGIRLLSEVDTSASALESGLSKGSSAENRVGSSRKST